MTTEEHISTIVAELFPEACGPEDTDYDFTRNELAKLAPEMLEKIADRLAWQIGHKIIAWQPERDAANPQRNAEAM